MKKSASKIHINKFVLLGGFLLFCAIMARLIYLNLATEIDGINRVEYLYYYYEDKVTYNDKKFATTPIIYATNNKEILNDYMHIYSDNYGHH